LARFSRLTHKADGFGIGWYDPVETGPAPSPLKAVANPAPQALLQQSQPERDMSTSRTRAKTETETEQEVLKQRELEQEMENERPCVFKSISPVSLLRGAYGAYGDCDLRS
jgi:glutamine amidotransferase